MSRIFFFGVLFNLKYFNKLVNVKAYNNIFIIYDFLTAQKLIICLKFNSKQDSEYLHEQ
jgi:hypothetical protein